MFRYKINEIILANYLSLIRKGKEDKMSFKTNRYKYVGRPLKNCCRTFNKRDMVGVG